MRFIYSCLIAFIPTILFSQQLSKVKIDSSNNNEVTVKQTAPDSSQESYIDITKSDSNRIKVEQNGNTLSKSTSESNFFRSLSVIEIIVSITLGLLSIIVLVARIKKMKAKRAKE